MTLFLVPHGRTLAQPRVPVARRELDPAGFDEVWTLRERLPQGAAWCTAPEPAPVATAQLLTEGEVGVLADLRAHEPEQESAAGCRERVLRVVDNLLRTHAGADLVLVGHGSVWALLHDETDDRRPADEVGGSPAMPDVVEVAHPLWSRP